jgi:hypothetical protein
MSLVKCHGKSDMCEQLLPDSDYAALYLKHDASVACRVKVDLHNGTCRTELPEYAATALDCCGLLSASLTHNHLKTTTTCFATTATCEVGS